MKKKKINKVQELKFGSRVRIIKPGFYFGSVGSIVQKEESFVSVKLFLGTSLENIARTFAPKDVEGVFYE